MREAARAALRNAHRQADADDACGSRRRHPPHRRYAHGRRGARVCGAARRRSQRIRAACRSAAPAPCMPPRSPRSSACAASSCRRGRARSRRWACSAPTCCTTTSAPSFVRSTGSIPRMPRTIFREMEAKAASELAEEGLDPSAAVVRARFDMRYAGPGLRAARAACRSALPVAEGRVERSMPRRSTAARARFDDVHERIHGHAAKEKSVEVVSYRLRVRVSVPKFSPQAHAGAPAGAAAAGGRQGNAPCVLHCANNRPRRRSTIATALPSAPLSPAPPSSSSSMRPASCRPAGTRRSIATAISFWNAEAKSFPLIPAPTGIQSRVMFALRRAHQLRATRFGGLKPAEARERA